MRIHCARSRHLDVEQLLDRERVHELVGEVRRVVHARHVRGALHVRELLAGLLHAGVEVADDGLDAQHVFAVELHHEPQHAVRRRVLRTHVDDHRVAELVLGPHAAAREHDLARARRRAQLLRALVGLALEALLFGVVMSLIAGLGSPLNVTGTRAGASSLRSGWPCQSSGMRMRVRSGWPSNVMPNRSYVSRSGKFAPGYTPVSDGTVGSSIRHLADDADAPVARVRQEVRDDLEALELDAGRTCDARRRAGGRRR